MKIITVVFLFVLFGKSCTSEAQNDIANATFEYTANTRGFYKKIIIANKKATISKDREGKEVPAEVSISDTDWNELVGYFQNIKLDDFPTFKDPTQKRFYDGAAIAKIKVRYQDKNYETVDFDHGYPPVEIEKLVNKIVELAKEKE
jgi:hypothetical protein